MKIIEFIPQLGSGGGERFTVDLSNELSKDNEVILCVSHSIENTGFYRDDICSRVRIKCFYKKDGFDIFLPFIFCKFVRSEKPEVVHTHLSGLDYSFVSALLNRKVKHFHTIHSAADKETMDSDISRLIRKFLFKFHITKAITISPESHDSFVHFYGLDAPMILNGRCIPNSIIVPEDVRVEVQRYRVTPKTRIIVHLAHIDNVKRQDLMARVVARLISEGYDVSVLFLGRESDDTIVQKIREMNNPRFHLLGEKRNPLAYLSVADAMSLCSLYEGLPISLIEALGVGIIPVCTPVGGIVNVISDGVNGILSSTNTEESYYWAVKRFLDMNDQQVMEMKQLSRASFSKYGITECARKYQQLFSEK